MCDQVNSKIPVNLEPGCQITARLVSSDWVSKTVSVSIQGLKNEYQSLSHRFEIGTRIKVLTTGFDNLEF